MAHCLVAVLMWASSVAAQPAQELGNPPLPASRPVVLLVDEAAHPRSALFASLQIQLASLAEVRTSQELHGERVAERIEAATTLAQHDGVLLVVWSDDPIVQTDGSQEAVLYAVGERQGRALLEVVRVPGGQGPEMDRTLAIKVREVVEGLLRGQALDANALQPTAAAAATPVPDEIPHWQLVLGAGATVGTQPGSELGQWGVALRAGPSFESARLRGAAFAGLDVFPSLSIERDGARVQLSELAPQLGLGLQRLVAAFWLGVHSGVVLSLVNARGTTANGSRGQTDLQLGSWLVGLDAELPIATGLAATIGLDLQTRFEHRELAVNGRRVTELATLRPLLRLGLAWRTP